MATILAISSQVASGHVGLSAIVPVLHAMCHTVIALPTVLLSNHPGHAHVAGQRVDPVQLRALVGALSNNGRLGSVDAVLTGYLPTAAHVEFAIETLTRVRAERARVNSGARPIMQLCDPVLGDVPKGLYIEESAASAIRDHLLPGATLTTPNRFELGWLTGAPVDTLSACVSAARSLKTEECIVTSAPADQQDAIGNLHVWGDPDAPPSGWQVTANGAHPLPTAGSELARSRRYPDVPHGTGDTFAALLLGHRMAPTPAHDALARATAGMALIIEKSIGAAELALAPNLQDAIFARPHATRSVL